MKIVIAGSRHLLPKRSYPLIVQAVAEFEQKYGGITEETAPRLERLVDASITGCNAGAAYVCFEAAAFLAGSDGPETYPLTADLFRAACKLPTRPGEEDVRDAACKNEALVRAAIAKGK